MSCAICRSFSILRVDIAIFTLNNSGYHEEKTRQISDVIVWRKSRTTEIPSNRMIWLILRISNYIHDFMLSVITRSCLISTAVSLNRLNETWLSNYIPMFDVDVITKSRPKLVACLDSLIKKDPNITQMKVENIRPVTQLGSSDVIWRRKGHQDTTWTNVDFSLVRYCGNHLGAISWRVPESLFCIMGLKIICRLVSRFTVKIVLSLCVTFLTGFDDCSCLNCAKKVSA